MMQPVIIVHQAMTPKAVVNVRHSPIKPENAGADLAESEMLLDR